MVAAAEAAAPVAAAATDGVLSNRWLEKSRSEFVMRCVSAEIRRSAVTERGDFLSNCIENKICRFSYGSCRVIILQ